MGSRVSPCGRRKQDVTLLGEARVGRVLMQTETVVPPGEVSDSERFASSETRVERPAEILSVRRNHLLVVQDLTGSETSIPLRTTSRTSAICRKPVLQVGSSELIQARPADE